MTRSSERNYWRWAIALSVGLILVTEIGLRVLTDHNSRWNVRLGANKQHDSIAVFRNKPNYDLGNGIVTNEYGYMAPRGITKAVPDGVLRVLVVGDSNSVVPYSHNYPSQAEAILESELGVDVQTINTAVPGYSSQNARRLFESEVSTFDADHFVVYLGWNDLGQYGPEGLPYKKIEQGYEISTVQRALSNLYLIRFLYAYQRYRRHSEKATYEALSHEHAQTYEGYWPHHFDENLRAILELAKIRYRHVYIASMATITSNNPDAHELERAHFPAGMDKNIKKLHMLVLKYDNVVRQVAGELDVELLDFHKLFDSREARRDFTDSCHMNQSGAGRLARLVADAIIRNERAKIEHSSENIARAAFEP